MLNETSLLLFLCLEKAAGMPERARGVPAVRF